MQAHQIKIKELIDAQREVQKLQQQVLLALFEDYPNLTSIETDTEQQYDDNNYYMDTRISGFNGISLPESIGCFGLEDLSDNDEFKSSLVEMNLKESEIETIVSAFFNLDQDFIEDIGTITKESFKQ